MEREDALDILACLVERSIDFNKRTQILVKTNDDEEENSRNPRKERRKNDDNSAKILSDDEPDNSNVTGNNKRRQKQKKQQQQQQIGVGEIEECIASLRKISGLQKDSGGSSVEQNIPDHSNRMLALDELERSYTYASEMNRAALSAYAWLCAIGRSSKDNSIKTGEIMYQGVQTSPSLIGAWGINSVGRSNNDSVLLQKRFLEKENEVKRLDQELSVCRAEIGRLRNTSRAEVSTP